MKNDKVDAVDFPCIVQEQFKAIGTDINIQIVTKDKDASIDAVKHIQQIKKIYADFSHVFSRFLRESELSKLNENIGKFVKASNHVCEISLRSLEYNKKTGGLFDPRILSVLEKVGYLDDFETGTRTFIEKEDPVFLKKDLSYDLKVSGETVFFGTKMDFSGIAKGYITDQIVKFLDEKGIKNFLIDSGGDIFMRGKDECEKLWTVDIEGIDSRKIMFALSDKSIATSGIGKRRWEIDGKRFHHIIDPKNPEQFLFDVKSVSVISDSTTDSDVWAKTLFLLGKENGIIYANEKELAAVFLDYRGSAWISPKAKEYLLSSHI
ncbi:MAG: Thiamine biosynthesis lipoprotein [Candidatus Moranbacteria bacterium GW2011_GWD2_36_12]|nr:MAG: Thiamine biosynthesis lipoprotein [Candidatus Moranbacteria bacterium GW2011_GWD2_36_12]KKQ04974.1 MAG: Thiamine biosynthesis lipoprotein [Candidatus Moranbacteria bacterium GW2011_GWE2_36_40]